MSRTPTHIIILCLLWLFNFSSSAQNAQRFSHLGVEDGLGDSWVHNAIQDSRGFMWFATNGALSRFDGQNIKNYRYIEGDSTSLHGHNVMDVVEDNDGALWVATIGGGLNKFNFETESFEHFPLKSGNEIYQRNTGVCILIDSEENIWLGTFDTGFYLFNRQNKTFKRYDLVENLSNHEEAFRLNSVLKIIEDIEDPSTLWLASNTGLYSFNKRSEKLEFHPYVIEDQVDSLTTSLSIFMDRPGQLWVGTWAQGLCQFNTHTKKWKRYFPSPKDKEALNYFSNIVDDIERKSTSELWLCSRDQGLMVFNIEKEQFEFIKNQPNNPYSIKSNKTNGIYIDPYHRKWIFNFREGISILDPAKQQFQFTGISPNGICPDVKNLEIVDFAFDRLREKFYVSSTGCEAIHVFNKNGKYMESMKLGNTPTGGGIEYKILVDSKGLIWLADNSDRKISSTLLNFDPENREFYPFNPSGNSKSILQNISISSLCETPDGTLWLGTNFGGLVKIDRRNNEITQLLKSKARPDYLDESLDIKQIKSDAKGNIWIATLEDGVYVYRPKQDFFDHFPSKDSSPNGLVDKRIMTIEEGKNGHIWIGTSDNGIQVIDPDQPGEKPLRSYGLKDGLLSEKTCQILRDKWDNIWVSTHRGINRFSYENDNFIPYAEKDGIEDPMLLSKGFSSNDRGDIFIGQFNGFYTFKPYLLRSQTQPPKLAFTSFKLFEEEKRFEKDLNFLQDLILEHNENFFSVGFTALQFTNPEKNKYAYFLKGFDTDWTYPQDERNFATYTKVPPGEYTLMVKATNNEGIWSENAIQLAITIKNPWWLTGWAYVVYLLAVSGLLFLIYKFTIQRQIEQREAQRILELDKIKSRLYTNITHEFKTPLTLILGPVSRAISRKKELGMQDLNLIKGNAMQLLNLINQMLDLGKIDAGALKPNLQTGDIVQYVQTISSSFESFVKDKKIDLSFTVNKESALVPFDKEMILAIVSNLLSNAIKFTPNGGQVDLNLNLSEDELQLEVRDSGIGIDEAKVEHIFDRFYQVEDSISREATGTGIGLALVKELVELLNGNIEVESRRSHGSVFKVKLPLVISKDFAPPREQTIIKKTRMEPESGGQKQSNPTLSQSRHFPIVLIIEDHKELASYISSGLEKRYQIQFAENGQEGIEKALAIIPDLIICDLMMPIKDGYQVCKRLKQDSCTSHIPIILLTAKSSIESKLKGLQQGADVYLTKPFNDLELQTHITNLLNIRKKLQNHYLKQSQSEAPMPSAPERVSKEEIFLQKVAKIIEDNLESPALNVALLSKKLHLSHTQCHRKLIALTGQPPVKIIRNYRMRKAKKLIENTSLNVSEIAYNTGFSNPAYFTRIFKQEFGCSPSEYRKTVRG